MKWPLLDEYEIVERCKLKCPFEKNVCLMYVVMKIRIWNLLLIN